MMKKLLVLMMVLGMATMANAAIKLSVNGQDAPDVITLYPSDYITIGVVNIDYVSVADRNFWAYVDLSDLDNYTVAGAALVAPGKGDMASFSYAEYPAPSDYGEYSVSQTWTPGVVSPVPAGLYFQFELHCDGISDVVVDLWDYNPIAYPSGAIVDTVTIHQIPEPITMALLGLGGLFLRRRK